MKKVLSACPTGVELWFGRGRPLHPYVYGRLVELLREKLIPKDLRVAPGFSYPY